ncbi:MAG: Hint domain-containing protein [Rhodobacteraceae bacterium]|nr:Hint domain-containing protein [Paracoccaceae bacterium]
MSDYTLDWTTANVDGTNVLNSSGEGGNVTATVSTPANAGNPNAANAEFHNNETHEGLYSYYPDSNDSAEFSVAFSEEVSNVTFDIKDIDQGNWDDHVEIFAYDAAGNRLDVSFSNLDGQTTTAYTIEGNSSISGSGTYDATHITVTIEGPVASFTLVFGDGSDHYQAGWISVTDIKFDEAEPVCFARGTLIETKHGEVAVEDLVAGDMVRTLDNSYQPIRWIGSRTTSGMGRFAPILLRKGTVGNTRDLYVSPAHRVLVQGWRTQVLFGHSEMLTSAISLVNGTSIIQQKCDSVDYFHILFEKHEVIFSDGAPTESFDPSATNVDAMGAATRDEIYALFPELEFDAASFGPVARNCMTLHEAAILNI